MAAHSHGFAVRPLGVAVALCAPRAITPSQIGAMLACFTRVLRDTETRQLQ